LRIGSDARQEIVEKKDIAISDSGDETPISSSSTLAAFQYDKVPKTNAALLVTSKRVYTLTQEYQYPVLAHENEVIIRNRAVGLNPIDWQSVEYQFCLPEFPWITGREMSGIVEAVGKEVVGLKVGDRVWTSKFLQAPSVLQASFFFTCCRLIQWIERSSWL
jgi:hypothetical protein